jgi:hypothetical protein
MRKQFWIIVPQSFTPEDKHETMMSFIDPDAEDRQTVYLDKVVAEEECVLMNKNGTFLGPYVVKQVVIDIED